MLNMILSACFAAGIEVPTVEGYAIVGCATDQEAALIAAEVANDGQIPVQDPRSGNWLLVRPNK